MRPEGPGAVGQERQRRNRINRPGMIQDGDGSEGVDVGDRSGEGAACEAEAPQDCEE
jgi:hypothetical protein